MTGALVGVGAIKPGIFADNYMAYWDNEEASKERHRPWLIPLFASRYRPEIDRIIKQQLPRKLKGR